MAHPRRNAFRAARHGYLADSLVFDDGTYRRTHPDVDDVVTRGVLASGLEHYYRYGRWEGRKYPTRGGWLGWLALLLLWVEALLRTTWERCNPWAVAPRLVAEGFPWRSVAGPEGMRNFRAGPWRTTLRNWQTARYVVVELRVQSPIESTTWSVHALTASGDSLEEGQALECQADRVMKRVVRLPAETVQLECRCLSQAAAWIAVLRMKPVSPALATRMMRRRLAKPELGTPPKCASAAAPGTATLDQVDALWSAYHNTFPLMCRPTYDWWVQRVEGPRRRIIDAELSERVGRLPDELLFSVLVPVFNTSVAHLRACLESIRTQSFRHWEACVVDDASTDPTLREVLTDFASRDGRFRIHFRKTNGHISRASQDALKLARGRFVILVDHDDELARHALLIMAEALRDHPDAVLVYSDEDKLDSAGNRCDPHFKPDFDPDRLLGHNYIAHLLAVRRSDALEKGGFRPGYEGSQDHDLVLRLVAGQPANKIVHVPEVLYHWRKHAGSTALQLASKPYALESGRNAVVSFLRQQQLDAKVEVDAEGQCLRLRWSLPPAPPRVSIIVPTRDAFHLISRCVRSILDCTDYADFEIVIVDNGSRDERTLRYLDRVVEDERVVVIRYDRPFNFSAINNFAASKATGSVLGFVNDDVEAVDREWLREMVGHAIRPGVGCVGAKLVYPDGRIQHAGVVLGIGGIAGHAFKFNGAHFPGYFSKLRMAHTVSAVTAACMLIQRRVFDQTGRFDEEHLKVAFNDVDLCLRVREAGYRNVLTPHAVLRHQESATRGSDENDSQRDRFMAERRVMQERWGNRLSADPYYSPHLSRDYEDFSLRANYDPAPKP